MDLKDLYREVILDHNKSPRLFGRLDPADSSADGHNPLCGDRLARLAASRRQPRVRPALRRQGLRHFRGVRVADVRGGEGQDARGHRPPVPEIHEVLTHHDVPVPEDLGKLAALAGVRDFPVRVKCASLAWHTLNAALERGVATVKTE